MSELAAQRMGGHPPKIGRLHEHASSSARLSGPTSRLAFARHPIKMVVAMLAGMGVVAALASLAFSAAGSSLTEQPEAFRVMLMAVSMTVTMVALLPLARIGLAAAWRRTNLPRTMGSLPAIATACVAAGLLAGPVNADASEAYNRGTAWLTVPSDPLEATKCTQRSIWLAAGTYHWRLYKRHWADPTPDWGEWGGVRSIWLRSGTYTWRDCLDPGPPPQGMNRGYDHVSTLSTPRGRAALSGYVIASSGNGTYEYGSGLLRTGR